MSFGSRLDFEIERTGRTRLRLVVALALLAILGTGAAVLPVRTAVPHASYTIYFYKAKVSVKGGTTLSEHLLERHRRRR